MKPIVDGLETELGERATVIRVNIQSPIGSELSKVYGIEFAPTFILFDSEGTESWRQIGGLDTQRVRDSIP